MDQAAFKSSPVIHRPLPNAVTYDLSNPLQTTIILPRHSTWSSELHWHEHHTEFLRVAKGIIRVRLGSRTFNVSAPKPGEPEAVVRVERFVRHEWCRADRGTDGASKDDDGEEVVVVESTDPAGEDKHVFFWNVNGTILEAQATSAKLPGGLLKPLFEAGLDLWVTLRLFVIFAVLDNCPSIINLGRLPWSATPGAIQQRAEEITSHIVLAAAILAGRVLRIKAVDERYTPDDLLTRWQAKDRQNKKER